MNQFGRRFPLTTFSQLSNPATPDNWWKDLLRRWRPSGSPAHDGGLRLAIRNNCLNFYRHGQSVAEVGGVNRAYARVHIKYASARHERNDGDKDVQKCLKFDAEGQYLSKGYSHLEFATPKSVQAWINVWIGRPWHFRRIAYQGIGQRAEMGVPANCSRKLPSVRSQEK